MSGGSPTTVFSCTAGGAIARGRRRLRAGLLAVAGVALAAAAWAGATGRLVPALLAAGVAATPWLAWRMSGDLDAQSLELRDGTLILQLRRQRQEVPLVAPRGRRLAREEIAHLEKLAAAGPVVVGSGGFDSHLLGEFDLAASDLANAVLLESGEVRLVVTPDRPEAFLAALAQGVGPPA
jgi:hypothetical protein